MIVVPLPILKIFVLKIYSLRTKPENLMDSRVLIRCVGVCCILFPKFWEQRQIAEVTSVFLPSLLFTMMHSSYSLNSKNNKILLNHWVCQFYNFEFLVIYFFFKEIGFLFFKKFEFRHILSMLICDFDSNFSCLEFVVRVQKIMDYMNIYFT